MTSIIKLRVGKYAIQWWPSDGSASAQMRRPGKGLFVPGHYGSHLYTIYRKKFGKEKEETKEGKKEGEEESFSPTSPGTGSPKITPIALASHIVIRINKTNIFLLLPYIA